MCGNCHNFTEEDLRQRQMQADGGFKVVNFETCPKCGGPMMPLPGTDFWYCPNCDGPQVFTKSKSG